jgi:monofunctional biosynthetic peptidoglycan transglycosylase
MTGKTADKPAEKPGPAPRKRKAKVEEPKPLPRSRSRRLLRWLGRGCGAIAGFYLALVVLFSIVPPPINLYQLGEAWRLGGIEKDWVPWEEIAPVMGRSAVAAEDANFCNHWGFDMAAIREAIEAGQQPGGQHDQPAGGEERLPLARPQLGAQGDGGGADPGGRACLVEAADS